MISSTITTILLSILTITLVFKHLLLHFVNQQALKLKLILLASDISIFYVVLYFYLIITQRIFFAPNMLLTSGFSIFGIGALSLLYLLMQFDNYKKSATFKYLVISTIILIIANFFLNDTNFLMRLDLVYLDKPYPLSIALQSLQIIFNISFCIIGLKLISNYNLQLENNLSSVDDQSFLWLKIHFLCLIFICATLVTMHVFDNILPSFPSAFFKITFAVSLIVAMVMITTYGCIKQTSNQEIKPDITNNELDDEEEIAKTTPDEMKSLKTITKKLKSFLEESGAHLDPNLKINTLANKSGIPLYQISKAINIILAKNFNEYINDFRIEEAKNKLLSDEYKNITILAIALESGFNSKSSFNSHFKKRTSLTPNEFKSRNNQ